MSEFQNTIDLLGDDVAAEMTVRRAHTEYNDDVIRVLGRNAFGGSGTDSTNSTLKSVRLPNLTALGQSALAYCYYLELADLGKISSLGSLQINDCKHLTTLILRSETLCRLGSVNYLGDTPFESGGTGGTVYVPAALITEYQNATNWSTLYAAGTCNFVAIEGSEYE